MKTPPVLRLRAGVHHRVRKGHLWVFRDEVQSLPPLDPGTLVRVYTDYGYDLGFGFYHPTSKIAIRLLSWHGEVDDMFFRERIERALQLRKSYYRTSDVYRLVFGESDFLPGLIIDRYGDWCAVQTISAGMDVRHELISKVLRAVLPNLRGIIAKNDTVLRDKEQLPRIEKVLWGDVPQTISVTMNNMSFTVDLIGGQKTGLYLDQQANYELVSRFAEGRSVLDCFTHQGGFVLFCLRAGATDAIGVDSSASALSLAQLNAERNGLSSQCRFVEMDVFNYLKQAVSNNRRWDMVILDPPAFAKSPQHLQQALRGYAEINRRALQLLEDGGILVSASCSHYVDENALLQTIYQEAQRVACRLRLLARGMQSPCHPVYLPMPQTRYLKLFVLEVARL